MNRLGGYPHYTVMTQEHASCSCLLTGASVKFKLQEGRTLSTHQRAAITN